MGRRARANGMGLRDSSILSGEFISSARDCKLLIVVVMRVVVGNVSFGLRYELRRRDGRKRNVWSILGIMM